MKNLVHICGEATEEGDGVAAEVVDVYCWRLEELLRAGYSHEHASTLAEDTGVDLHLAGALIARGCNEQIAFAILA